MQELYDLQDEYREMFGDQFPMMALLGVDENVIKNKIRECIESGKPYQYDERVFH